MNVSNLNLIICPLISIIFSILLSQYYKNTCENQVNTSSTRRVPKYILYNAANRSDILRTVDTVLKRYGYEQINITGLAPSQFPLDWDLLWSFPHHDRYMSQINWTNVKYYQKLNHFPANFVLVSKSVLSVQENFTFIPRGFLTSDDVQKYAVKHPNKRFVIKLKSNRGVRLMKPSEMNFTRTNSLDDYFAQEFVEDPLLWDGHKFDFSIFVVITSVSPLRLYIYDKNVNLRFCNKPYDTSNASDVDSYVIGTDHIAGQSFPAVRKFILNDYTYKDAFEDFMRKQGVDLDEIWMKVENLIRTVVVSKEKYFIDGILRFGTTKYSHFELYRFDMIFDKNINLFLLEVNMSPNLLATQHRIFNKYMFENVVYNLFNLIGIGTTFEQEKFALPSIDVENMVSHPNSITILPEICLKLCVNDCSNEKCKFCWNCVNNNEKYEMLVSFREQMNLGDFKRIFPPSQKSMKRLNQDFWQNVLEKSQIYANWFTEVCKKNKNFC